MLVPVEPLLHVTFPLQLTAVSVAFSPTQIWVLLAEITGTVGAGKVVIVTEFEAALVPQTLLQVAVYVPATTSMDVPVEPLLHVTFPLQLTAVSVAFSAPQSSVLLAEITGTVGAGKVVIVIAFEAMLVPQTLVQVAV